jgi:anti-anti-sigma factor
VTSSETRYRFEVKDGYSIVALLPDINNARWGDIEIVGNAILQQVGGTGQPAVMMDLSELKFMGSAVVALIVRVWKAAKEKGGAMTVVTRDDMVYEVLKIAGLTTIWKVVDSHEEAAKLLTAGGTFTTGAHASSNLLSAIGLVAVVGAGAGLGILLNPLDQVPPRAALAMEYGFSAVGMIIGTISAVRDGGGRRVMGILILLACLGIGLAGVLQTR